MWFYDFHARFLFFWSFLIYLALSEWFDAQDITTSYYYIILFSYFQDKISYFSKFFSCVFEGTNICGLSAEYVCYGLFFVCLIKSVMNTRTRANGLTCLLTITYPAIILRLLSYSIIQRGVQQKCNTETEKLKNFFSITIAIPWISTLPIFRNIQATRIGR